jgi:uncharacterized protein (TIGR03000 family)
MNRSIKFLTGVGAVAVVTLALGVQNASAGWGSHGSSGGSHGGRSGWGSHGSSGGSWGSHGSSGGSWGSAGGGWASHGSSGGSSGRPRIGLLHRLIKGHRHYHGNYHLGRSSWGSSGGSWGSHGSSGGSWGSSGGGSWGSSSPSMYTPSYDSELGPTDGSNGILPDPNSEAAARGEALLSVQVPESARIYVNGRPTTSTGAVRQYLSRGLSAGMSYTYEVRAEATVNGQTVEQTKTVKLQAGGTADLAFDLTPRPETSLTLRVPADARVLLAGTETKGSGEVRVFRTTALESGEEWSQYAIRVLVERDGETLVREETISLKAGDTRTLNVSFDAPKIASTR